MSQSDLWRIEPDPPIPRARRLFLAAATGAGLVTGGLLCRVVASPMSTTRRDSYVTFDASTYAFWYELSYLLIAAGLLALVAWLHAWILAGPADEQPSTTARG